MPVLYSDPPNAVHAGLDLAQNPEILSSAFAARDSGEQQMLAIQAGHAMVLCAVPKAFLRPVVAGDAPAPLRGFVICNFEIKAVLDEASAEDDLDIAQWFQGFGN